MCVVILFAEIRGRTCDIHNLYESLEMSTNNQHTTTTSTATTTASQSSRNITSIITIFLRIPVNPLIDPIMHIHLNSTFFLEAAGSSRQYNSNKMGIDGWGKYAAAAKTESK